MPLSLGPKITLDEDGTVSKKIHVHGEFILILLYLVYRMSVQFSFKSYCICVYTWCNTGRQGKCFQLEEV